MTKTYLITPGELNSVGLEVTLKALSSVEIKDSYIFYTQENQLQEHVQGLTLNINPVEIPEVQIGLKPGIYYIESKKEPVDWFKEACVFCAHHFKEAALITGPLIKSSF